MTYVRYRHIAIGGQKASPSGPQIATIEALLGVRLPGSFLEFLDAANGGLIDYVIDVPVGADVTGPLSFRQIFSTDEGSVCDETFVGEIRAARENLKAPLEVLPFARDGGGSVVYLDLTQQGGGRVVAFAEGLPAWTGRRTAGGFVQLAESFEEYLEKLRLDRDTILDTIEVDTSSPEQLDAIVQLLDIGLPDWRTDYELSEAVARARGRLSLEDPKSGEPQQRE